MTAILVLAAAGGGGFLYRARGRRVTDTRAALMKRFIVAWLAMPFALIAVGWTESPFLFVAIFGLTFAALLTGHASHIDLGHAEDGAPADGQKDEWYARWLRRFDLPPWWHDAAALALNGCLIVLPLLLVALGTGRWEAALWLLAAGLMKPPAYCLGWAALEEGWMDDPLKVAEPAFGAMLWGALALATC